MQTYLNLPTAFIQNFGWAEIVIILFVILLLFGAKRLPELARGFGKSIKEFKKATSEIEDDLRTAIEDEPATRKKETVRTDRIEAKPAPKPEEAR
jgi:sec-independent protein translocase protein TatA